MGLSRTNMVFPNDPAVVCPDRSKKGVNIFTVQIYYSTINDTVWHLS